MRIGQSAKIGAVLGIAVGGNTGLCLGLHFAHPGIGMGLCGMMGMAVGSVVCLPIGILLGAIMADPREGTEDGRAVKNRAEENEEGEDGEESEERNEPAEPAGLHAR